MRYKTGFCKNLHLIYAAYGSLSWVGYKTGPTKTWLTIKSRSLQIVFEAFRNARFRYRVFNQHDLPLWL